MLGVFFSLSLLRFIGFETNAACSKDPEVFEVIAFIVFVFVCLCVRARAISMRALCKLPALGRRCPWEASATLVATALLITTYLSAHA